MVALDEFVDGVSVHLGNNDASNVPRLAVVFAARQALKRFCDESFAYVVNAFDPLAGTNQVLSPNDFHLSVTDRRCEIAIPDDTHIIKVWQLSDECCDAQGLLDSIHSYPNIINLPADDSKTDNVVVSLSINQATESCPDFIYQRYYDGLLSGTIAYLQLMPNREWSEPNMAQVHMAAFDETIRKAKSHISNGFLKGRPSTSIPATFG